MECEIKKLGVQLVAHGVAFLLHVLFLNKLV